MLTTPFTELLGCRLPLQQAPMGGVTTPELVAAVAGAGAVGMVPAQMLPAEALGVLLDDLADRTSGVVGVTFLLPFGADPACVEVAAARARLVDFYYADPDPALVAAVHAGGALASWQAGSAAEALAAVDAGCDLVAVQGYGGRRPHPRPGRAAAAARRGPRRGPGAGGRRRRRRHRPWRGRLPGRRRGGRADRDAAAGHRGVRRPPAVRGRGAGGGRVVPGLGGGGDPHGADDAAGAAVRRALPQPRDHRGDRGHGPLRRPERRRHRPGQARRRGRHRAGRRRRAPAAPLGLADSPGG